MDLEKFINIYNTWNLNKDKFREVCNLDYNYTTSHDLMCMSSKKLELLMNGVPSDMIKYFMYAVALSKNPKEITTEIRHKHISIFNFINLIKEISRSYDILSDKYIKFDKNELKRLYRIASLNTGEYKSKGKSLAYSFLKEKEVTTNTKKTYFTRTKFTNDILEKIDIPDYMLVQILNDYDNYINNNWKSFIEESRKDEIEKEIKRNQKKTFTKWLR